MSDYKGYQEYLKSLTKTDYKSIQKKVKEGKYQEIITQLAEKNGNELTPTEVVEEARLLESPLHKAFEWNDSIAGEKYRLMQARLMIYSVKVTIEGKRHPAFISARVIVDKKPMRKYFPIDKIVTDEKLHSSILFGAIKELRHFQRKYGSLEELKGIINEEKLEELDK